MKNGDISRTMDTHFLSERGDISHVIIYSVIGGLLDEFSAKNSRTNQNRYRQESLILLRFVR